MRSKSVLKIFLLFSSAFLFDATLFSLSAQTTILNFNSAWKYLDNGTDQGTAWRACGFSDGSWASGNGRLGYEDASTTCLKPGASCGSDNCNPTPNNCTKYITYYFRNTFTITGLSGYTDFTINLIRDDGAVVYVNGVEVWRDNMPTGTISYTTLASAAVSGSAETSTFSTTVASSYFVEGSNCIAVEVHQNATNSSDLGFDLQLVGNAPVPLSVTRGPYMNMANQSAVTFRWRTNTASNSRVEVGLSNGSYTTTVDDPTSTTEHEVRVTGLSTDTKYFYRIGSTTEILKGDGDASYFFRTAPATNSTRKMRFAAFGDCGRGNATNQDASLNAYKAFLTSNSIDAPDAWLLMGDNAYNAGLDGEYTSNFFNIYSNNANSTSNISKNHILFPTPGNHDYANTSARQVDHNVPYYNIFTLPTAAQSGGTASGTEAYYSWDWGNVHFMALDSYGKENGGTTSIYDTAAGSAQMDWIRSDIAATNKRWIIAYWHHPPYTMGSHNSDTESDLVTIRQKTAKVLERLGVDLIINGHSHVYERSMLIDGHYGLEGTFSTATHAKSTSSAKYNGTANSCPYITTTGAANKGVVYVVAGSTGSSLGTQGSFPHAAFPYSLSDAGVFYFEVEDNRLDAKFIRDDNTIWDQFTILKDAGRTYNIDVTTGQTATLTASWPGTYLWNDAGASTTQSISYTPMTAGNTTFTVKDLASGTCLTDQITVRASGPLPVHLTKYLVYLEKGKVHVDWTTASEERADYFTVERSADGFNYSALQKVMAAGNSSTEKTYAAIDNAPLAGLSYYRLSQTDADGHTLYFDSKKITNGKETGFTVAYSVSAGRVKLSLSSLQRGRVNLRIYDMSGRTVMSQALNLTAGFNQEQIRLTGGTYIFNFSSDSGISHVQKIVVP